MTHKNTKRSRLFPWRKNDFSLQDRYIQLDGSRLGTHGISRLATSPIVQYGIISDLIFSTYETFLSPADQHDAKHFWMCVAFNAAANIVVTPILHYAMLNKFLPISADAAIDTHGRISSDLTSSKKMKDHYFYTFLAGIVVPGLLLDFVPKTGLPPLVADFYCAIAGSVSCFPTAFWALNAYTRLHLGRWTIHTNPPSVRAPTIEACGDKVKIGIGHNGLPKLPQRLENLFLTPGANIA